MKKWIWILIVSVAIIALFIPYNWLLHGQKILFHCINVSANKELSYGELGDFIGGVFGGFIGTIIAGIACYFVYKTYISQKEELEFTRQIVVKQQFETTFFNLIHIHKECLDAIQYYISCFKYPSYEETKKKKKELLEKLDDGLLAPKDYEEFFYEEKVTGAEALYHIYAGSHSYKKEIKEGVTELPCYSSLISSVCMTFKYIGDAIELNEKDRKHYMRFFSSQITKEEWRFLHIFFCAGKNGVIDNSWKNFVELARNLKIFDYAFPYIKDVEKHITMDNLYDTMNYSTHQKQD